jgi:two-component system LytT family response regulator
VDAIERLLPDLVLLDVRMPGLGGLEVARALTGHVPFVIFVTAYDEYALKAFEVHAIDYLLKPVERERFVPAIERVRALVANTTAAQRHARLLALLQGEPRLTGEGEPRPALYHSAPAPASGDAAEFPRRFLVKGDGQMYFVAVDDIDWVEAYGNYVRLHVGRGVHLIRETLGNIERKLDPTRFARVHRSSIVNLDRVARMDLWGAGDYVVLLKDGTKLKLSRWYRSRIEEKTG